MHFVVPVQKKTNVKPGINYFIFIKGLNFCGRQFKVKTLYVHVGERLHSNEL